jgi:nuclear pore complex protein Nup93
LNRNYLLAQAQIDAPALSHSIAHLNANTTFSPRTALADTDVAGYIRAAHEQSVIASIEAGRKSTQADFYRLLEERAEKDWEERKRRVVETLGSRLGGDASAFATGGKRKGSQLHVSVSVHEVKAPIDEVSIGNGYYANFDTSGTSEDACIRWHYH